MEHLSTELPPISSQVRNQERFPNQPLNPVFELVLALE